MECAVECGWNRSLHPHLDGFERAETDIGNEFSRCGGGQVEDGLVLGSILFASQLAVEMLEVFVESVLSSTLHGVADESWADTGEDTAEALSLCNRRPRLEVALVELCIDLATAFDQIEGSHSSVGGTLHWG